jgi:glutamate--cysteine ligase
VRYVEVRSLDVDPFAPLGASLSQLSFVEAFVVFCLLAESPRINASERAAIDRNQALTAQQGRSPGIALERDRRSVALMQWADDLLAAMEPVVELLDGPEGRYRHSWIEQREKVRDSALTPSARILAEMNARGETFVEFARRLSEEHRQHFTRRELGEEPRALFGRLARESLQRQYSLEEGDVKDFDEFLADYFAGG